MLDAAHIAGPRSPMAPDMLRGGPSGSADSPVWNVWPLIASAMGANDGRNV